MGRRIFSGSLALLVAMATIPAVAGEAEECEAMFRAMRLPAKVEVVPGGKIQPFSFHDDPRISTAEIHRCLYVEDMQRQACGAKCPTFDAWKLAHADVDPTHSRADYVSEANVLLGVIRISRYMDGK